MYIAPETKIAIAAIVRHARAGNDIIPMYFSHVHGRATVAAAIRMCKKQKLIVQNGTDGCGKPLYVAAPFATQ